MGVNHVIDGMCVPRMVYAGCGSELEQKKRNRKKNLPVGPKQVVWALAQAVGAVPILYPPPHIPSGSEQNPTDSHQIPTKFRPYSYLVTKKGYQSHSESFRPTYRFK